MQRHNQLPCICVPRRLQCYDISRSRDLHSSRSTEQLHLGLESELRLKHLAHCRQLDTRDVGVQSYLQHEGVEGSKA